MPKGVESGRGMLGKNPSVAPVEHLHPNNGKNVDYQEQQHQHGVELPNGGSEDE